MAGLFLWLLILGVLAGCGSDPVSTGSRLGGVLSFEPGRVNFARSQEDDSEEIKVKNNSGSELTIYEINHNKSYLNIEREFPVTLKDLESITLAIDFDYEKFDGVRRTSMEVVHSDTSNSPDSLQVLLPIKREVVQRTFSERDEWAVDYHSASGGILVKRKNTRSYTIGTLALNQNSIKAVYHSDIELTPVAYSPDGDEILFYKDFSDSTSQIFTIPVQGGEPLELTDSTARDIPIAYSPEGDQIIMHSNRSGNREIYLMNRNGSEVIRYTNHPAKDTPVGITSNSRYLIFNSERNSPRDTKNIFRINADDGTGLYQLNDTDFEDEAVDLSPTEDRILFFSQRDGGREVYTMNTLGGEVKQLTYNYLLDYPVAYHPDGETILYFSRSQTNKDVYTISESSLIETRITDDYGRDTPVTFIEGGELILFNSNRNTHRHHNIDIYTSSSFVY